MKVPNNGASSVGGDNPMPMDDASLAPEEVNMEEPMPMDDMGEEMPADNMAEEAPMDNMEGDETMDVINQLSPKDKEAVKSYAESLISKDETNSGDNAEAQEEPMQDGLNMEVPMNETFIFSKKQLNKLMENFGPSEAELEKEEKPNLVKKHKNVKNSPFNAPDFE